MTANAKNGLLAADGKWQNNNLKDPLSILVLNLMPTKRTTERQFLSTFDFMDRDVELTFLYPRTHHFKTVSKEDIERCYCCLDDVCNEHFDGMITTGAPVETLAFSRVDYIQELKQIFDWAETHVTERLYECWAAQAELFLEFGVEKRQLPNKLFGIYGPDKVDVTSPLLNGLGGNFKMPQSRNTAAVCSSPIEGVKVVASSEQTGPIILRDDDSQETFFTGHPEYTAETLLLEYHRDLNKGIKINKPENYFVGNDEEQIDYSWRTTSLQLYNNWINLIKNTKEVITDDRRKLSV
ncbi:homoserine O-succinyltransferase [Lentilactobacillus sp. Marseille-Q4993]|uniref:homoserine O-acetyltransferase/O-succinyltransferase family protein n=1 Tax=Lentilactobacillus sp. Marseille-Q4993 TaxID=3039492 RepID=UPI0024BC5212|nr:homoserine O-succinyltransferase [Lentilactobacillus sp. Marseille-Q4993]